MKEMRLIEARVAEEREDPPRLSHRQIFWRFLQFGLMAWGGPVAQIGMLRRELVEREHWMSSARFNRLLAVFQVLPGPEAHEMCVYFGTLPGGRLGGLLAGLGFMLPGFVLMFALSWLYFRIDLAESALAAVFLGMQPAVIALIVRAVHRIGAHVLIDAWLWGIAAASMVAALGGVTFWLTLPVAGILYALIRRGLYVLAGLVTALAVAAAIATAVVGNPGPSANRGTSCRTGCARRGLAAGVVPLGAQSWSVDVRGSLHGDSVPAR